MTQYTMFQEGYQEEPLGPEDFKKIVTENRRSRPNKKDKEPRKRIQFFADSTSQRHLQELSDWYEGITGKRFSKSLILRRALDGLHEDICKKKMRVTQRIEVLRLVKLSDSNL